jgi:hypothetical protein
MMATTAPAPNGFSKNPADPFAEGGARDLPIKEFNNLVDLDSDGFPEYLGPYSGQTVPVWYLSNYNGTGFRPYGADDAPGVATVDDDGAGPTDWVNVADRVPDVNEVGYPGSDDELPRGMSYIYYQTNNDSSKPASNTPQKDSSFQIIFAGFDNDWGNGGAYDPDDSSTLDPADYDNVTNFSNGPLFP